MSGRSANLPRLRPPDPRNPVNFTLSDKQVFWRGRLSTGAGPGALHKCSMARIDSGWHEARKPA